ncbi:MAG: PEGA domain-containing protein [bacterium]|jgi:hypothetical protein
MANLITRLVMVTLVGFITLACFAQTEGAKIAVSTSPDQATVFCDGIERGASPSSVSGLPAGAHLIAVDKDGYLPVQRTVTVSAEGKSVVDIKLEKPTGLVLLRSTPVGADIEINGAHRGKTPLLLTDLPFGKYRIKASSLGYLSRDVEFEIENRSPQLVSVSLTSDSAVLTVKTEPSGASVKVNGLSKGVTPCTIDRLPAGENELNISLPDYVVYRSKIKLLANQAESLDITLKPVPGVLSVISIPTGAKLYIDEKLCGQTPLTLDAMDAGSHVIRAELDGFAPETRTIDFQQGEKKVEELRLERNMGIIEVMAKPDGVKVFVDGSEQGMVMLGQDNPVARFSQDVAVGDHVVSLRLKGYGTVERRVTIEKGKSVTLKEVLKRVFNADTRITLRNGDVMTGILEQKLPNGDIKLETQIGIYKTIAELDIATIEAIKK